MKTMDGDGEAGPVSGGSQREKKDLKMDAEDLEEPHSNCAEPGGLLNKKRKHSGNSGVESSGFLPAYPVCVPQDKWEERGEEDIHDKLLHSCCAAEDSIDQASSSSILEYWVHNMVDYPVTRAIITPPATPVTHRPHLVSPVAGSPVVVVASTESSGVNHMLFSPMTDTCSPISSMCSPTTSAWGTLRSTSRSPGCSDRDPVSAAAHLHLLGESLSLIGHHLQETDKMVNVSSSLSLLLDSLLCALAPLLCLTTQIPELRSSTQHTLASTLENISYVMPGL